MLRRQAAVAICFGGEEGAEILPGWFILKPFQFTSPSDPKIVRVSLFSLKSVSNEAREPFGEAAGLLLNRRPVLKPPWIQASRVGQEDGIRIRMTINEIDVTIRCLSYPKKLIGPTPFRGPERLDTLAGGIYFRLVVI